MKKQDLFSLDLILFQIFNHTIKSLSCIGHIKRDSFTAIDLTDQICCRF